MGDLDHGLVADIGRQSVRFGIAERGASTPRDVRTFGTAEHPTFTSALVAYLTSVGLHGATLPSVLAVAGAVRGDLINLTGSRWYISLSGVEAVLRMRPRALNECAANALALTTLAPQAFASVAGPTPRPPRVGGSYLVIAPGTGLGVAALVTHGDRLVPVQSEAGHMTMTVTTPEEARFAEAIRRRGGTPSIEAALSAGGLIAAHGALGDGTTRVERAEDVTRAGGSDPAAAAAIKLFLGQWGAAVGDLTLAFGAWDGVFLTGAMARALAPRLAASDFRRRMETKAAFRRQLSEVPVAVVDRADLELVGAVAALHGA